MNEIVWANQGSWLVTFLASVLIWIIFAGLLILWLVDGRIKKEQAIHAFLAAAGAWLMAELIKTLFPSARPFELNGFSPLTLTIPHDGGFPSSHTAAAAAAAITIFLHQKRLGLVFILGALLVGLGRLMANVHYLFDILGGGLIGLLTALGVEKLHLFPRKHA
jgi:undecaprenyl-diphosphatase